MKRIDNKGFAISTMLYGLLIIIVLIIAMILNIMAFNRKNSKEFTEKIVDELETKETIYPVCLRANTLHTETCSAGKKCNTNLNLNINVNETISYGNLGTTGSLILGDAFDCDVNGDGEYNSLTERFYYLKDETDTTALLVYYHNTLLQENSNMSYDATSGAKYSNSSANTSGPTEVVENLPLKETWKNTDSFNSNAGYVCNEIGATVTFISYTSYGARLLKYSDINGSCSINKLYDNCRFLLENTGFAKNSLDGLWLETPSSSFQTHAWYITSQGTIDSNYISYSYGVRPVIAINKEKIQY